jgi:hypothetical protein
LAMPTEEPKSASRGLHLIGVMMISLALAGIAMWSWTGGWFGWLMLVEVLIAVPLYAGLRASVASTRWESLE